MRRHPETTLAIIAGGSGQRLGGVPKGLIQVGGRAILERLLDLGSEFAEVLLVSDAPEPYRSFPVRAVPDVLAGRGAPGGVHSALVHASTPWVLAVAVDMPFITPAVVDALCAEPGDVALVCFSAQGRLQPFPGRYAKRAAARWGALLGAAPSFGDLFSAAGGVVLEEGRLRSLDPELGSIVSVNTPADARRVGADLTPARMAAGVPATVGNGTGR